MATSDNAEVFVVRLLQPHEDNERIYKAGELLRVDRLTRDFMAEHGVIERPATTSTDNE